MKAVTLLLCTLALAGPALAAEPAMPQTPAAIDEIVYARPFSLDEGFKFYWRKERPQVTEGLILVLKADKNLLVPRAAKMPILFVGAQTAQPINQGHESGYLVAIVPGTPDLTKTPIWFGTPDFPDQIDAADIEAEQAKAEAAGMKAQSAKNVQGAHTAGGETLEAANLSEVLRTELADLILEYSPQDKHIAEGFRVPVVRREAKPDED